MNGWVIVWKAGNQSKNCFEKWLVVYNKLHKHLNGVNMQRRWREKVDGANAEQLAFEPLLWDNRRFC